MRQPVHPQRRTRRHDRGRLDLVRLLHGRLPRVHGPGGRLPAHYHYEVTWSDDDGEFVGAAAEFPSLSFLAATPHEALAGIRAVVLEVLRDMVTSGETPPVPAS